MAKAALIGRAAADNNRPGTLPCPDVDDDGKSDGNFGFCTNSVGRLPWKTLDLPDVLDGDGNRLWYTLAHELQDNDDAPAINPKLPLELSADGATEIAAIVFSPGSPLPGQNGRPGNNVTDYLDGANQTGGPYVSGPVSAGFNDRLITISHDQLFYAVNRRIQGIFRAGLGKYYVANANLYPEGGVDLKTVLVPHFDADTAALLNTNDWYALTTYTPTTDRQQATVTLGGTIGAIYVAPETSCTITPAQISCTHP